MLPTWNVSSFVDSWGWNRSGPISTVNSRGKTFRWSHNGHLSRRKGQTISLGRVFLSILYGVVSKLGGCLQPFNILSGNSDPKVLRMGQSPSPPAHAQHSTARCTYRVYRWYNISRLSTLLIFSFLHPRRLRAWERFSSISGELECGNTMSWKRNGQTFMIFITMRLAWRRLWTWTVTMHLGRYMTTIRLDRFSVVVYNPQTESSVLLK